MQKIPLSVNKPLISLAELKAFCQIGQLETLHDEELKEALNEGVSLAENITGLTLTLNGYKLSGFDERLLMAPFFAFTSLRVLNGAFLKRGANLYEMRGELDGVGVLGFFTDELLRSDENIKELLKQAKTGARVAGTQGVRLFSTLADEPAQDNTPPADNATQDEPAPPAINGGLPDMPLAPLPPADSMDAPAHQPTEGEPLPPADKNIVSPLPLDGTLPLNEEDVSELRNALIKAGFLPLPSDIKGWLKNYVYASFKKESWDHAKNDKVLKHYRLGNYF